MEKMILTGYIFHSVMNLDIIPAVTFPIKNGKLNLLIWIKAIILFET